jgi:hypothetical protein
MQAVRSTRQRHAQAQHLIDGGALRRIQPVLHKRALHPFPHQTRRTRQVDRGNETRHMRAAQQRQQLVLDLAVHEVGASVIYGRMRELHDQRKTGVRVPVSNMHAKEIGHAAGVNAGVDHVATGGHARVVPGASRQGVRPEVGPG